jgi:hypothetical protein
MKRAFGLVFSALVLFACKEGNPAGGKSGLTKNQFIQVYTELRQAQTLSHSAPEFQQRKQQILQKAGITEQDLHQFVNANLDDVTLLADVFDTISNRLSQPPDTAPGER